LRLLQLTNEFVGLACKTVNGFFDERKTIARERAEKNEILRGAQA
jgi:hypothetical protein